MNKLYDDLKKYAGIDPVRFHMPGHKGTLTPYDVTELSFSDDLHAPKDGIKALEDKLAETYSMDRAFLLINGSSGGITGFHIMLGMLYGSKKPKVLLTRDAHRSAVSACALSGADVLGIDIESQSGAPGVLSCEQAENILKTLNARGESADALCITSPNYYGVCADVEKIADIAHRYGAYLFVDCAHGAHFPFSDKLPKVPNSADAFVVSTHKTLRALNQTGALFIKRRAFPEELMQNALSMVQTTSPSYPLMLSVDSALDKAKNGEWDAHIERVEHFLESLSAIGIEDVREGNIKDVTRVVISSANLSMDGQALAYKLETRGIYVEMADMNNVVLITTPADKPEWYDRTLEALSDILKSTGNTASKLSECEIPRISSTEYVNIREAWIESDVEWTNLKDACGRRAVQALGVYPPGTTVVFPGERITAEAIEFLKGYSEIGAKVFGVNDGKVKVVRE